MLDAYRRVLGEVGAHNEEHVRPVTTTQGEAYFPTTSASFPVTITCVTAATTSSLKFTQEASRMTYISAHLPDRTSSP